MIYKFKKEVNSNFLTGKKIAIVLAYFYEDIANKLLNGSLETLEKYGLKESEVDIFYAPGAFEVPLIVKKLTKKYAGIITLGAVIKGETPHFDFVAGECATGVMKASYDAEIPIAFGILTTDNMEQTLGRCGGYKGNKGVEAAMAMIESIYLLGEIES